jgi:hypothetical protein
MPGRREAHFAQMRPPPPSPIRLDRIDGFSEALLTMMAGAIARGQTNFRGAVRRQATFSSESPIEPQAKRRSSFKKLVQIAIVVGAATATYIGTMALGKASNFEQDLARGASIPSEARPSTGFGSMKTICVNSVVSQPKLRACLATGGTKYAMGPDLCWHYAGRCTGSGPRQCVTGPNSQSPDAITVTQCCTAGFQYPWIQVCPGQPVSRGCGVCLF